MNSQILTRKGVLLDTNLLLLYLVGSFDINKIASFKRTNQYTEADFVLLRSFLLRSPSLITTPNILTETTNLLETLNRNQANRPFSVLVEFLNVATERYLPSWEIAERQPRHFFSFGLSDAVILELAKEGYLVLTDDLDLCFLIQGQGFLSLNFTNLRDR